VTIVQTVLVYVVIPAAVLVLFAALTLWPKAHKSTRYRSGEGWDHAPVWWAANPDGVPNEAVATTPGAHALGSGTHERSAGAVAGVVGGGARGTW